MDILEGGLHDWVLLPNRELLYTLPDARLVPLLEVPPAGMPESRSLS